MSEQLHLPATEAPDSIQNNYHLAQSKQHSELIIAESQTYHNHKEHPHNSVHTTNEEDKNETVKKVRGIGYTETELGGKPFVIAERLSSSEAKSESHAGSPEPRPVEQAMTIVMPKQQAQEARQEAPAPEPSSEVVRKNKPVPVKFKARERDGGVRTAFMFNQEGDEARLSDAGVQPLIAYTEGLTVYYAPEGAHSKVYKTEDEGQTFVAVELPEGESAYKSFTVGKIWENDNAKDKVGPILISDGVGAPAGPEYVQITTASTGKAMEDPFDRLAEAYKAWDQDTTPTTEINATPSPDTVVDSEPKTDSPEPNPVNTPEPSTEKPRKALWGDEETSPFRRLKNRWADIKKNALGTPREHLTEAVGTLATEVVTEPTTDTEKDEKDQFDVFVENTNGRPTIEVTDFLERHGFSDTDENRDKIRDFVKNNKQYQKIEQGKMVSILIPPELRNQLTSAQVAEAEDSVV